MICLMDPSLSALLNLEIRHRIDVIVSSIATQKDSLSQSNSRDLPTLRPISTCDIPPSRKICTYRSYHTFSRSSSSGSSQTILRMSGLFFLGLYLTQASGNSTSIAGDDELYADTSSLWLVARPGSGISRRTSLRGKRHVAENAEHKRLRAKREDPHLVADTRLTQSLPVV